MLMAVATSLIEKANKKLKFLKVKWSFISSTRNNWSKDYEVWWDTTLLLPRVIFKNHKTTMTNLIINTSLDASAEK